jgi:hypothetical protein
VTIQDLQITSDQFAGCSQFRTSDGKLIKVKNFCVEEDAEPVSIKDADIGSRLRLRNGEVIEIIGTSKTPGGNKKSEKYWHFNDGRRVNFKREFDVVEILELKEKQATVPLTGLQWGDTFRTRDGEVFRYEGEKEGGHFFGKRVPGSGGGLYFREDGRCSPHNSEYEVVEITKASRVALNAIKIGDRFRIRTGEILTCNRLDRIGSPIYSGPQAFGGLYYGFDGKCNSKCSSDYDAVELIERNILDDARVQLEGVDSSCVDRVVVSSEDWPEIWQKYKSQHGDATFISIGDVRVYHDGHVKAGHFYLLFKVK